MIKQVPVSPLPWRRGIGNDCHTIFDAQDSIVAQNVGTSDGTFIEKMCNASGAGVDAEKVREAIRLLGEEDSPWAQRAISLLEEAMKGRL